MKRLIFDIETNGLNEIILNGKGEVVPEGTEVFCMVTKDVDSGELNTYTRSDMDQGIEALRKADLIIGHNITMFDIPFLERYYGAIDTDTYDTLIVSRLMYPDLRNHPFGGNSLKHWGKELGMEKIEYDNFDYFCDEMLRYCIQDVEINLEIYNAQSDFRNCYEKNIKLEHLTTKAIARQIDNGFGFDLEAAEQLELELLAEKAAIDDHMREIFPPITEERWSDKTGNRLKDKVTVFNPGSRKQIAERLSDKYKWQPPLTDKGNPKVDAAVLKKLDYPEARELVKQFDITKLQGQVTDWLTRASSSRDGRIHGNVNVQGTVTGRMTASQPNMQQVSSDKRARALFKPRDGWVQVGVDAKSLEARMLANRMHPFDQGSYGEVVLNGDVHILNQKAAGLSSKAQAKTFFYALIYGAGDEKIGQVVGKNRFAGKQLKEKFLDKIPAIRKAIEACQFQVAKKGTITLLDGREVPCRSNHVALNVQLQGDGAIVMKLALCILMNKLSKYHDKWGLMATVHDEWQLEVHPDIAEKVGLLGCEAIREAGQRLDCKINLDGDYAIGKDWSECH